MNRLILVMAVFFTIGSAFGAGICQEKADGSLRFMTLNVWSGLDYKGTLKMGEYETPEARQKRFDALVQEIKTLSPDVIGINEANFLPDYVERLAAATGYDYIYHVGISGLRIWRIGIPWNLKEGDAILARKSLKLRYVGRKQLSENGFALNWVSFHTDDLTQVILGRIQVGERPFFVAVTHWHASPPNDEAHRKRLEALQKRWGYSEEELRDAMERLRADQGWRIRESKTMLAYLKQKVPEGAPLVVMGDFNAEPDTPEMQRLFRAGLHDTFEDVSGSDGFTWDAQRNRNIRTYYSFDPDKRQPDLYDLLNKLSTFENRRIDLILRNEVIPASAVIGSKVCADRVINGVHPSDHFGVLATIRQIQ